MNRTIIVLCLASCNLGPRVADPPDSGIAPPKQDAAPDGSVPFVHVLPPGSVVPGIDTDPALIVQIKINDGLVDTVLDANLGVVKRGTGKSAGNTSVRFWNFGVAPMEGTIAVVAPLYVFGTFDDAGVFTASTTHPQLIDTLPGDIRYSPIRRVVNVPFTASYDGELITSLEALGEALERGLVGDPVNDSIGTSNTWVNLPVVLPGTTLELGGAADPMPARQVYGRGYLVDVFELGTSVHGRQPFRFGFMPVGQTSGLQTGVAAGDGSLPTAIDASLVFQFAIPVAAPAQNAPNYSPLATDVTVRLADGVAPADVNSDTQLFKRSGTGAITAFFPGMVESFTIGTTVTNLQLQFVEGMP